MIAIFIAIIAIIIIIIIKKNYYEMNIINLVLSKINYCPKHYKIIRKNNKIFIKCHYYTENNSNLIFNGTIINKIKKDSNNSYYITIYSREQALTIFLNNYDKNKE